MELDRARLFARGGAWAHASGQSLAERGDGGAVGGGNVRGETEKHYRRITGYEHLWMLKAHLYDEDGALAELQKAG